MVFCQNIDTAVHFARISPSPAVAVANVLGIAAVAVVGCCVGGDVCDCDDDGDGDCCACGDACNDADGLKCVWHDPRVALKLFVAIDLVADRNHADAGDPFDKHHIPEYFDMWDFVAILIL